MPHVNLGEIQKSYEPLIEEINEIVGIWEFWIEKCPIKLKIKVIKIDDNSDFPYTGIPNYSIQCSASGADAPYRSIHANTTVENAIRESLNGFFRFYKPDLVDQTSFILDEKW